MSRKSKRWEEYKASHYGIVKPTAQEANCYYGGYATGYADACEDAYTESELAHRLKKVMDWANSLNEWEGEYDVSVEDISELKSILAL